MNEASASLQKWMRTDLLDKVNEVMTHLTVGLYTLIMEMFHAVIGVIVSVYILFGKETFINQSKKQLMRFFLQNDANLLIHIAVKTNEIFGGFIIGKMIDSDHYRNFMLYWYIDLKDAVCNACQCNCRGDQCDSVLRTVY